MIRQGLLGTIIHADAAYIHHQNNFVKNRDGDMWRIEEVNVIMVIYIQHMD